MKRWEAFRTSAALYVSSCAVLGVGLEHNEEAVPLLAVGLGQDRAPELHLLRVDRGRHGRVRQLDERFPNGGLDRLRRQTGDDLADGLGHPQGDGDFRALHYSLPAGLPMSRPQVTTGARLATSAAWIRSSAALAKP
jgi:hypothetical protein